MARHAWHIALIAMAADCAAAHAGERRRFDIPPSTAAQGIRTFATQAHRQILVPDRLVRGRRTAAVRGSLGIREALVQLLANSGLTVRSDDGSVIVLREAPVPGPDVASAAPLPKPLPPLPPQEIVVTGISTGLDDAAREKRRAVGIVEVVHGRELANYPHGNVADLLQRVSSVTVTVARDAGEGRQISVRGLGPDYTRVRVNGMDLLSATGGTDSSGGVNRARAIDLNVLAGDLFSTVTVRKTADAADEEGALGASLDMQVARPLDPATPRLIATAQASTSDTVPRLDPSATLSARIVDADRSLGVGITLSYERRRLAEEGHGSGGWQGGAASGGFSAASPFSAARDPAVFSPRFPRYGRVVHDQQRFALAATGQYRPTPDIDVTLDIVHAAQAVTRRENWLETLSFARGAAQGGRPDVVVRSGIVNAQGDLVQGVFDAVDVESEARLDRYRASTTQAVLAAERRGDRWTLRALAGLTRARYRNPTQINVLLNREDSTGYSYDYRGNADLPEINYGFDVADPAAFAFAGPRAEMRLNQHATSNDEALLRLSATRAFGGGWSIAAGLSYKQFDFNSEARTRNLDATILGAVESGKLAGLTGMVEGFGDGLGIAGHTPTRWVTPDIERFVVYYGAEAFALSRTEPTGTRNANFGVRERVPAQYLQLQFDRPAGLPMRGNIGVRHVDTQLHATGFGAVDGAVRSLAVDHRYRDWLPSANIVADLDADVQLRLAAAKVMARPSLTPLAATATVDTAGHTATAGNPRLAPIRADALDAELQWRFTPHGLVSVGLFWKRVRGIVQYATIQQTLDQAGIAARLELDPALSRERYLIRMPVNTPGGTLGGIELALQMPFRGLPTPLDRFGIAANYTLGRSRIRYRTPGTVDGVSTHNLLGLSPNAANALLYYEHRGVGIRLSASHRDRYLTAVPGALSGNDVDGVRAITTVDVFASIALSPHIQWTVEALNLTDARNVQFDDSVRDSIYVATRTGRRFGMGFRCTY